MTLRIIGDVHCKYSKYLEIIKNCNYSFQLGDFGFHYYPILKDIDANHHKFGAGNHDNHDDCGNWPHFIGKFGYFTLDKVKFFGLVEHFQLNKRTLLSDINWIIQLGVLNIYMSFRHFLAKF